MTPAQIVFTEKGWGAVQLPEEPNPSEYKSLKFFELEKKAYNESLPHPILFKEEEQEKIRLSILENIKWSLSNDEFENWQPKKNHPYPIPEGFEVEFEDDWGPNHENTSPDKYAILTEKKKEDTDFKQQ